MYGMIAFIFLAWTAATWFSGPYGRPFLGLPFFAVNPLIPFVLTLLWSSAAGLYGLTRHWQKIRQEVVKLLVEKKTAILILAGILLVHLVVISGPAIFNYQGENDSDSALHGVAGYHIAAGSERPMYVYGVHYTGSLKTHLGALFNLAFGKSPIYQRAIGAFMFCGFLVGFFIFVRRLFDEKTALLAAFLASILPYAVAAQMRYDEFIEIPFWGIISLNLLLSLTHEKKEDWRYYAWYGVVLGLLFFAHPQAIYFILTGLVVLFAADKLFLLRWRNWLIPLGFVIGTTPTWVDSYFHDWVIFKYFFGTEIHEAANFIQRFAEGVVRFYRNFTEFWGLGETFPHFSNFTPSPWLLTVFMAVVVVSFLYYGYISRPESSAFIQLKNRPLRRLIPLVLALVVFAVYAASAKSSAVGPFRYIFPLWLVIPVVIAAAATVPQSKTARGVGISFMLTCLVLFSLSQVAYRQTSRDLGEKWQRWLTFCKERGITHFYGDFWLVYNTNFISKEEILGSACFPLNYDPYMKYREKVDRAPQPPAYVFSPQLWPNAARKAAWFEKSLAYLGIRYRKETINGHLVYYNLSEPLIPAQLVSLQLLNGVAYKDFSVQKVGGGEGGKGLENLRLVTMEALNSGQTILYADGSKSIAELVVTRADGTLLRKQPLEKNVLPGEHFSCQTLLSLEEAGGQPVHLHVKLNDIIVSPQKQPLVIPWTDLVTAQKNRGLPPIDIAEIYRRLQAGYLPGFMFSKGWGKRLTGPSQILQWSGAKESELLFFVKDNAAGTILELLVEPFADETFGNAPQVLDFSCNNHPVTPTYTLKTLGRIQVKLSGEMLQQGLNRLVIRPRLVEPECRRIRRVPGFALRPRAFAVHSLEVSGSW